VTGWDGNGLRIAGAELCRPDTFLSRSQ